MQYARIKTTQLRHRRKEVLYPTLNPSTTTTILQVFIRPQYVDSRRMRAHRVLCQVTYRFTQPIFREAARTYMLGY